MDPKRLQVSRRDVLELAGRQHGVVARRQLIQLGLSSDAIKQRIRNGRLHPLLQGVYALGRPGVSRHGRWMAAVLRCGPDAVLSHHSAAALWEIASEQANRIDISLPARTARNVPGIVVHRRANLCPDDLATHRGIPVTTPICTLVDLADRVSRIQLETAISEADKRDLTDPDALRSALPAYTRRRGVPALRRILDRRMFVLTTQSSSGASYRSPATRGCRCLRPGST